MNDIIMKNKDVHNKIVDLYNKRHPEIYNLIEQERLSLSIKHAIDEIASKGMEALDYGSGDGNITEHLLKNGMKVTAADVSDACLKKIKKTFNVPGILLNGMDLYGVKSETFDFVGLYSVIHHIPDYCRAVEDIIRVLKPGGIIYIDHEVCMDYWDDEKQLQLKMYMKETQYCFNKIKKYFRPRNYLNKLIQKTINPHFAEEGDIHVFKDDPINWEELFSIIEARCQIINIDEYLLFRGNGWNYSRYLKYKQTGLTDTICIVARKK